MPQALPVEELHSTLLSEELRVTFQVALVGTDGLIVGSDRRQLYFNSPTDDEEDGSVQPGEICKFIKSADEYVVCAFAGGPFSEPLARAIVQDCNPSVATGDLAWKDAVLEVSQSVQSDPRVRDEVFVIRRDTPGNVLLLNRKGNSTLTTVMDWKCSGNNSIPARFVPWHLWQRRPVSDLKNLALITLVYAEQESPTGIGSGFDLMTLRNNGSIEWERITETGDSKRHFQDAMAKAVFSSNAL